MEVKSAKVEKVIYEGKQDIVRDGQKGARPVDRGDRSGCGGGGGVGVLRYGH